MTSRIVLGNLTVDRARFEAFVDGRAAALTFVEFELLYQLARRPGTVITRSRLANAVWRGGLAADDRRLTVHVSRLRKKVRGTRPWRIATVPRRGYALVSEDASDPAANGRRRIGR